MLKGYRTLIFNGIMGVVMIVRAVWPDAAVPDEAEVGGVLDKLIESLDMIIAVAGNIWLRFVTTTPVAKAAS